MRRRLVAAALVAAACSRSTGGAAAVAAGASGGGPAAADPIPAAGVSAAAPAGASDPSPVLAAESAWIARSADGRVLVAHAAAAGGACAVEATDGGAPTPLWRSDACLGWRSDPVFVSASGDRVLVLRAAAHGTTGDWSAVEVAALFERGKLVRAFRGDELVVPERIAAMRAEETWARGLKPGVPEPRPRYEPGDRVRIETVDDRVVHVGFDGSVSSVDPAAVAAAAGPAADDEAGLYKWTDDAGEVHYTNGAEIPQRYRSRAKPVRAQVGVVAVERVSSDFAPSRYASTPARRATPPPAPAPKVEPPREKNHFDRIRDIIEACPYPGSCGGVKINQKPQVCTTVGDITTCRDAK